MSDYMYLLDSHVSREQAVLLNAVQQAASEAKVAIYLSGGAMRDMLGGFPIRDLDFTFEGLDPHKLAASVAAHLPGLERSETNFGMTIELRTEAGATGSLRQAHTLRFGRAGTRPKPVPAHLLEDLAARDFTMDAMAISLAPASRGLIRDPMNGQSSVENREIRACNSQVFMDDPSRMVRAVRFRHRFGFQLDERTTRNFENAVEANVIDQLSPADWHRELEHIAEEAEPSVILRDLEDAKLLPVPAGTLDFPTLSRFEKQRRLIPGRAVHWPLFLHALTAGLKPRDRKLVEDAFGLDAKELEIVRKVKPKAVKLGNAVKSPSLRRPSQVYNVLKDAGNSEMLLLLLESPERVVLERLRNYFEKFLPAALEVTDAQVEAGGAKRGTAQFDKARNAMIAARLNGTAAPPEPPPPPPVVSNAPSISPSSRSRALRQ